MFPDFTDTFATIRTYISPLIVNSLNMKSYITFLAKSFSTLWTWILFRVCMNLTDVSAEILDRDATFWALFFLIQMDGIQMFLGFRVTFKHLCTPRHLTWNFLKKSRIRAFSTFGHENGKVLSKKNPETIPSLTCPSERDKDRHYICIQQPTQHHPPVNFYSPTEFNTISW